MAGASDPQIVFLTFDDICDIHDRALEQFGEGAPGFVDEHVVRSAAAQAEASVFGQYLHDFPAGMAAAYLFFLARQQGFTSEPPSVPHSCFLRRTGSIWMHHRSTFSK